MSGDILILGAGGHGKVVADILCCAGARVRGFLDDDPATWGTLRLGLPVLGAVATHAVHAPAVILGIGDIAARRDLVARLSAGKAPRWCVAIHPRATLARSVAIGAGVTVMAGAVVNADTTLGDHCVVNTGATVDHDCAIGPYAHIAPGAHLAGGVHVGAGALIGIGAVVTPNLTIGVGSVVAAGAVVIADVPDGVTVKGVPARP